MNTPFTSIFDRIMAFLRADLSLSLTLGYVLLISLGILFNQFYYGYFGVDALSYSELTDFLVAPIRNPLVLAFFFANLFFFYALSIFDEWILVRFPKLYTTFSMGFNPHSVGYQLYKKSSFVLAALIYVYIGIQILAQLETNKLRKPNAQKVDLILKTQNESLTKSRFVFIGKIGNYLIMKADTSKRQAIIYPMEEVHEIRMVPKEPVRPKRK